MDYFTGHQWRNLVNLQFFCETSKKLYAELAGGTVEQIIRRSQLR